MRIHRISIIALWVLLSAACLAAKPTLAAKGALQPAAKDIMAPGLDTALFAGGCFWSIESAFEKTYGVVTAISGYAGGSGEDPSYEDYAERGFVEVVQVIYDPERVSYPELLDAYWRHSDPTDSGGAFFDRGPNYRPIVYWYDEKEKAEAEASKAALAASGVFGKPIVAAIESAPPFYPAEDYHQDYALKNPDHYAAYRVGSGRDAFFGRIWGPDSLEPGAPPKAKGGAYRKPGEAELKKSLTPLQFEVTQREGTEPPYDNEYLNEHREGIFVDIVSGEALFSSRDKYESGTGWPSFTRPLVPANVVLVLDRSLGMERIEVRSHYADSHLGHVFDDGPAPLGLRYCMNSASLRFVPKAEMEREGYGAYLKYLD